MVTGKPIIDPKSYVNSPEPDANPTSGGNANPGGGSTPPPQPAAKPIVPAGQPTQTSTGAVVSSTVPEEFKASSYAELIPELEKRMAEYKPMTEEELKKLRRRQKIEGIISGISDASQAVANLIFTHHYAPNMYNAADGMTAKAKARFDKEKAERDADAEKYLNYAITIGKMKDADKERGLQAWNTEQTLARTDRAYDAQRQNRADDVAFRDKDYDTRVRQWQENFDREGKWHEEEAERWERQFKESVRQFNVNSSLERQRINIAAQQAAAAIKQGQMTFNLGPGNGNVTLTVDKLNAANVSRIYATLPANVRSQVQGDPIVQDGFVVAYKPPTTEAMLVAIGANVGSSPATQKAIKQVAGLEKGDKPAGY